MEATRFKSISHLFTSLAPEYRSRSWTPFYVTFPWDRGVYELAMSISTNRCKKRLRSYLIPGELKRSKGSLRFGHEKSGQGISSKGRGDFCLLGGHIRDGHLTLFYRSLELVGGMHFDTAVWAAVEDEFGDIDRITIFASKAFVFGVKGRVSFTKERLYSQVLAYHRGNV